MSWLTPNITVPFARKLQLKFLCFLVLMVLYALNILWQQGNWNLLVTCCVVENTPKPHNKHFLYYFQTDFLMHIRSVICSQTASIDRCAVSCSLLRSAGLMVLYCSSLLLQKSLTRYHNSICLHSLVTWDVAVARKNKFSDRNRGSLYFSSLIWITGWNSSGLKLTEAIKSISALYFIFKVWR